MGRPFLWLLKKEWRELAASTSWWILLLAIGPLTGISFISAMRTYAEISGLGGTAAGVGEALDPLVGIWAPAFSACEVAAVFLLPFVAIRLVAGDRQSGALKLELQHRISPLARSAAKIVVLVAAWMVAMLPPLSTILLWKAYGGSVYPPEIAAVALGHVLDAGLTIALGAAMASISENPSTAAILTLGITVGTWIVNLFGAVQGGWWERAADYTPAAIVGEFQHALVRLNTVLVSLVLILAGLSFAAIWTRLGIAPKRRAWESAGLGILAAAIIAACSLARPSWDLSESRGNSFSRADERALRRVGLPLVIEAHLAPEDPRRSDLERRAISKLRRVMPNLEVRFVSATQIGLFEQTGAHYGEIWYDLGGRRMMSRATTAEAVLESIFTLAGITPPGDDDPPFRGHPLAMPPKGAGVIYYGVWPALCLAGAVLIRRRLV
jgi:ABC-2 type transport system permease protein